MHTNILLGFLSGLLVNIVSLYLVQKPLKKANQMTEKKIQQKVISRYVTRNFAILIFLFILFEATDMATLIAGAIGLTIARFFLLTKQYITVKGVN